MRGRRRRSSRRARLRDRTVELRLLAVCSAVGSLVFLYITPVIDIHLGSYEFGLRYHPLFVFLRDDTVAGASGTARTLLAWSQLLATIALAMVIKPKSWKVLLVLYLALALPAWGIVSPLAWRWFALGLTGIALWRGWHHAAGFILAGSILIEPAAVSLMTMTVYGIIVGAPIWHKVLIVSIGTAAGAWVLTRHRSWTPLVPALALAMLAASAVTSLPAIGDHHDSTPDPEHCDGLDLPILNPLDDWKGQAWALHDIPGGMYVCGDNKIVELDESGDILNETDPLRVERISAMVVADGDVLGSSTWAMVRWDPETGEIQGMHRKVYPELKNVAWFRGEPYWTTMAPGMLLRGMELPRIHYYRLFGPLIVVAHQDRLFLMATTTIAELDPQTLQPFRTIDLGFTAIIHNYAVDGDHLYVSNSTHKSIEEIDLRSFTHIRSIPVGYPTRYVSVSRDRGILASTNFFEETVDFFELESGRKIRSYRVGPRPRAVIYSAEKRAFLCVSACGIFRIPLSKIEDKQGP